MSGKFSAPLVLPPARTVVEIDPNVRVRGNLTLAERRDCRFQPVKPGEEVVVAWKETNLGSTGKVVEVDEEKDVIVLSVDWEGFKPRETCKLGEHWVYADELAAMKVGALERLKEPAKVDSREALEARLRQLEQSSPR